MANASTLAKITESEGNPLWNGAAWPGGPGGGTQGANSDISGATTSAYLWSGLQLKFSTQEWVGRGGSDFRFVALGTGNTQNGGYCAYTYAFWYPISTAGAGEDARSGVVSNATTGVKSIGGWLGGGTSGVTVNTTNCGTTIKTSLPFYISSLIDEWYIGIYNWAWATPTSFFGIKISTAGAVVAQHITGGVATSASAHATTITANTIYTLEIELNVNTRSIVSYSLNGVAGAVPTTGQCASGFTGNFGVMLNQVSTSTGNRFLCHRKPLIVIVP